MEHILAKKKVCGGLEGNRFGMSQNRQRLVCLEREASEADLESRGV